MANTIRLGGSEVAPGERRSVELPLPTLYSQAPVYMPVHVINGRRPGPVLFVSAAIHGDEINGVEIIRRLLQKRTLKIIRGALIAVPIVNIYGFVTESRYLPDRRDLNRSFPGTEKGSMAARLANTFMTEIVSQCTHGVDLHTGAVGRENLPQIRAKVIDEPEIEELASAFGAPVIINSEIRDGSLREAVLEQGIPVLLYEAGEALRFNEVSIRAGVKGVMNVMRHLDMLPKRKKTARRPRKPIIASSSKWVRAPISGILRAIVPIGAHVTSGQVIALISDPFGYREVEVVSTISGIVIGKTNIPLVHEGEALFHVALFSKVSAAVRSVEHFNDEHDPLSDTVRITEPPVV